jgi:hypothetical protein
MDAMVAPVREPPEPTASREFSSEAEIASSRSGIGVFSAHVRADVISSSSAEKNTIVCVNAVGVQRYFRSIDRLSPENNVTN